MNQKQLRRKHKELNDAKARKERSGMVISRLRDLCIYVNRRKSTA